MHDAVGFIEDRDDYAVINITQKRLVSPQDGEALKSMVEGLVKKGMTKIVFSFAEVDFMSSSILGALISISSRLRAINGAIQVKGLNENIREIFAITNLDKVFNI